jgi:DNA-directed RNA polymerase specialized sigma24 family protein
MPETPIREPEPARFIRLLRKLARRHVRYGISGGKLQANALAHEAYLRLFQEPIDWRDKAHFLTVAGLIMRRILADHTRGPQTGARNCGTRSGE